MTGVQGENNNYINAKLLRVSSLGDAKSSLGDAKSSLGGAKSSLGDAESSLGDARSSLGDAESSLGDAKSSLGDAKSSLGDAKSSLGDAKSSLGDAKSSLGDTKSSLGDVQGERGSAMRERDAAYVPTAVNPNLEFYLGLVDFAADPDRGAQKISSGKKFIYETKFGMPEWNRLPLGTWAELQEQINLAVRPLGPRLPAPVDVLMQLVAARAARAARATVRAELGRRRWRRRRSTRLASPSQLIKLFSPCVVQSAVGALWNHNNDIVDLQKPAGVFSDRRFLEFLKRHSIRVIVLERANGLAAMLSSSNTKDNNATQVRVAPVYTGRVRRQHTRRRRRRLPIKGSWRSWGAHTHPSARDVAPGSSRFKLTAPFCPPPRAR
jgi:hypothetical protein